MVLKGAILMLKKWVPGEAERRDLIHELGQIKGIREAEELGKGRKGKP